MRLRSANPADLDAILALERECFRTDRLTRVDLVNALSHPRARLLVLADRAGLAGYALLRWPPGRTGRGIARIDSLGVARRARGRGLARRLVRGCERIARRERAGRLRLEVRANNRPARALYAGLGFAALRDLPRYYADGGRGLRLEKALAAPRRRAAPG
jgi:ribosomal protein S18 acetylase RimI-like enzyme